MFIFIYSNTKHGNILSQGNKGKPVEIRSLRRPVWETLLTFRMLKKHFIVNMLRWSIVDLSYTVIVTHK